METNFDKFVGIASRNLGATLPFSNNSEEVVDWGENKNPPSSSELNAEIDRLVIEDDWKTKREKEYPSIQELVVALYDTDDKADIEAKRAAVKAKYPKPS